MTSVKKENPLLKLLLLEDNDDDARLVITHIENSGFQVQHTVVCSRKDLIQALENDTWEIIISDYAMPSFNGMEALEICKKHNPDIPFIITSGTIGEDIAVEAMRAGAQDYVMKDNLMRLVPAIKRELKDAQDRIKRRLAQTLLRETEERFKRAFHDANIAMMLVSRQGDFLLVNKAACMMFGYNEQELFQIKYDQLTYEQDREECNQYFKQLTEGTLEHYVLEKRFVTKKGKVMWGIINSSLIRFASEKPNYVVTQIQDISRQKEAYHQCLIYQDELRKMALELGQVEEKQRRAIAYELHDDITQKLISCIYHLDYLTLKNAESSALEPIKNIRDEILKMIDQTRSLCFDLSNTTLYKFGLEAAIYEYLKERIQSDYSIKTHFYDDNQPSHLDEQVKVTLYRIIQELLTNVVKHAKASEVTVKFNKDHYNICIEIEDNGKGFEYKQVMGLQGKNKSLGLFSIQERTNCLGGTFNIESTPAAGTKVAVNIPLKIRNERVDNDD